MKRSEKFWDKRSNEYDRNEDKYEQSYNKTVENTRKYLSPGDTVLDYACGTGIITNELAENVKEIHAIDISSKMIDVARRKAGEREIDNVHYAKSTLFDERYERESFDVILAFNILHLLDDAHRVMHRIYELLKPGGLFISATACLGERRTFFSIFLFLLSKIGLVPYLNLLTLSELEDLVVDGNFQIVETEDLDQTPPNYFIVARKIT